MYTHKNVEKVNSWPKTKLANDFTGWLLQGLITREEKERLEKDKGLEISEVGEDYYAKTHSNCCDSLILNGICMSCKEHTVSQAEHCCQMTKGCEGCDDHFYQ